MVHCNGIAQEAEIKICMLEQSVKLGWLTETLNITTVAIHPGGIYYLQGIEKKSAKEI